MGGYFREKARIASSTSGAARYFGLGALRGIAKQATVRMEQRGHR